MAGKPWEHNWIREEEIGAGGLGKAYGARPVGGLFPDGKYVLKLLRNQSNPERRERMYREVAALKTLAHRGIPRVFDANVESFGDTKIALYFVSEFVPGATLENRIEQSRLGIAEAIEMVSQLTSIVDFCHSKNVIHRDIKPDNIILRDRCVVDPVLIDFGQSFNSEDDESGMLTHSLQVMGNKFLVLPELQIRSGDKRDYRSDLTQLVGVLFYACTAEIPVNLRDPTDRPPHRTPSAIEAFAGLPPDQLARLNRFFDRGFAVAIHQRFQSAEALRSELSQLLSPSEADQPATIDEAWAQIATLLSSPSHSGQIKHHELLTKSADEIVTTCRTVYGRFAAYMDWDLFPQRLEMDRLTSEVEFYLWLKANRFTRFGSVFETVITGSELVVTARYLDKETELFRTPVASELDRKQLSESVEIYVMNGLKRALS